MHLSFNNAVHYQTKEAYRTENFFINHTNWAQLPSVLMYSSVTFYVQSKVSVDTNLIYYFTEGKQLDFMLYTLGLGKDMLLQNYTSQKIIQEQSMNLLYNNGFSLVAAKPNF